MKKVKAALCLLLCSMLFCACAPQNMPNASAEPSATVGGMDAMPENLHAQSYTAVTGVDALGRTFSTVLGYRKDRYVGMFYWPWHGQHPVADEYDITKLLAEDPDALWDMAGSEKSPTWQFHWWGEPLWGYYTMDDEWVIRRQLELLTYAGVDFIAFDLSNGVVYAKVLRKVMKLVQEYREQGFDCPQVTFFTHTYSMRVVNELYDSIFKKNYMPLSWWRPYEDGKPYMIAYTDPAKEKRLVASDTDYDPQPYREELQSFFHFVDPQWPDEAFQQDAFPWVDWVFPQNQHNTVMSVSPASGPGTPMSHAIYAEASHRSKVWGRGWNGHVNDKSKINEGIFFQAQWDVALEKQPQIAFIDGWNEWMAQKNIFTDAQGSELFPYFADAVNIEFSRDIEPMKGGYGDNFYMQAIANIRAFKGEGSAPVYSGVSHVDWEAVQAVYRDFGTANAARKGKSPSGKLTYTQDAARCNIQEIRVAHDAENLYFKITAQQAVGEHSGASWMNLFLSAGEASLKGWEGYEYVINRAAAGSIERLNSDFTGEKIGEAQVAVEGNVMLLTVSKQLLGLREGEFSIYFKLADAVEKPADIMDYYVSGQSLPMGRLSFAYSGK